MTSTGVISNARHAETQLHNYHSIKYNISTEISELYITEYTIKILLVPTSVKSQLKNNEISL